MLFHYDTAIKYANCATELKKCYTCYIQIYIYIFYQVSIIIDLAVVRSIIHSVYPLHKPHIL